MLIVGERINASRRAIAEAICSGDVGLIGKEAKAQAEAGSHYIEVNAGTFVGEETERLKWLIESVQLVTNLPICVDSPDWSVIEAAMPFTKQVPMINSVTLEPARMEGILPLVRKYKAKVIGLCQSESSSAETTELKLELAEQLVGRITAEGIPLEDLYIDPLIYPLSTNPKSAAASLDAIQQIMKRFPGVHTICGLTNISYGFPARGLINRTFLSAAITRGLDSAILDPTDSALWEAARAAILVKGEDEFGLEYIEAFRKGGIRAS